MTSGGKEPFRKWFWSLRCPNTLVEEGMESIRTWGFHGLERLDSQDDLSVPKRGTKGGQGTTTVESLEGPNTAIMLSGIDIMEVGIGILLNSFWVIKGTT